MHGRYRGDTPELPILVPPDRPASASMVDEHCVSSTLGVLPDTTSRSLGDAHPGSWPEALDLYRPLLAPASRLVGMEHDGGFASNVMAQLTFGSITPREDVPILCHSHTVLWTCCDATEPGATRGLDGTGPGILATRQ